MCTRPPQLFATHIREKNERFGLCIVPYKTRGDSGRKEERYFSADISNQRSRPNVQTSNIQPTSLKSRTALFPVKRDDTVTTQMRRDDKEQCSNKTTPSGHLHPHSNSCGGVGSRDGDSNLIVLGVISGSTRKHICCCCWRG
jgi:hypothetical protein